jgi:hypothetical protein
VKQVLPAREGLLLWRLQIRGYTMERENVDQDAQDNKTRGKTKHEGDEGTVGFWLFMKALYKDEE